MISLLKTDVSMINSQFLDRIVQLSLDSVIIIDDEGIIVYVNQSAGDTFGYDLSELIDRPLSILLPVDKREMHKVYIKQFSDSDQNSRMMKNRDEITGRRKNGTLFPAKANILKFEENGQRFYAVILKDSTESHAQFQRINSLAKFPDEDPNPVMRVNNDGTLIYANTGSKTLLGAWNCKTGDKVPENVRGEIASAVSEREIHEDEITVDSAIYSLMIVPIKSEQYVNIYGREVTEQKRAEEKILKQLSKLAALRRIDMAITSGVGQTAIMEVVLEQTINELNVDTANIMLWDDAKGDLDYNAGCDFDSEHVKSAQLEVGQGYAANAALDKGLYFVLDAVDENVSIRLPSGIEEEEPVTCTAVSLVAKDSVKGVLQVFQRREFEPDDEWMDYLQTLAGQAAIALDNTQLFEDLQQANEGLSRAYNETIVGWSRALDLRDRATEGHTRRVTDKTVKLARFMGIDEDKLVHIRRGALLHDIGKMGVPDSILLKPGELNDEEWQVMRKHPQLAYDMLSHISYLQPALNIPHCHHEKWDGSGYPRRLKGEEIPLEARIFAVVDVCDALATDRPYRKAWSHQDISIYIRQQSGKHFDPAVVEAYFSMMAWKN